MSDRLQPLGLPQRGLCRFSPFGFGVQATRAPQGDGENEQYEQRGRHAEDQMACHGRHPFAADRRSLYPGDRVNRKALELAVADPPFGAVDLGADRVDLALPSLRDRGLELAARPLRAQLLGRLRITGEKLAVRAYERVEAAWAAADERVELLEILRHDRDRHHAVECAVRRRPAPRENEERRAESCEPRLHDFADISANVAGAVHVEETALAGAQVGWDLHELAGDERPAVTVDEEDRAQLRQRLDDELHALVQARLVGADGIVGHATHDFIDLGDGALDRLKDLERMLVKDIERTLNAVVGDRLLVPVVQPARKTE